MLTGYQEFVYIYIARLFSTYTVAIFHAVRAAFIYTTPVDYLYFVCALPLSIVIVILSSCRLIFLKPDETDVLPRQTNPEESNLKLKLSSSQNLPRD
jgi:hypothetical protein